MCGGRTRASGLSLLPHPQTKEFLQVIADTDFSAADDADVALIASHPTGHRGTGGTTDRTAGCCPLVGSNALAAALEGAFNGRANFGPGGFALTIANHSVNGFTTRENGQVSAEAFRNAAGGGRVVALWPKVNDDDELMTWTQLAPGQVPPKNCNNFNDIEGYDGFEWREYKVRWGGETREEARGEERSCAEVVGSARNVAVVILAPPLPPPFHRPSTLRDRSTSCCTCYTTR